MPRSDAKKPPEPPAVFLLLYSRLGTLADGAITSPPPGRPSTAFGLPLALPCAPALSPLLTASDAMIYINGANTRRILR